MLKALSADETKREVDATETIRAERGALSPTPVRVDEIVRATDAPRRRVLAALAELELAGETVTHVGGSASRAAWEADLHTLQIISPYGGGMGRHGPAN
jgi:predicted Rossmann fold nucleotide-binding protein DprA/Smf involved in DNA uptake